jgi:anti-sigma regulatory factor (Ser/Thr protein kinase)
MISSNERACGSGRACSLELELERSAEAPAIARAAIAGLCEQAGVGGASCHTLLLLVSEIVTNAVVHSDAPPSQPIEFSANARSGLVRVEVADGGRGFHPAEGVNPAGGWGLRLVQQEAARWGIDTERGTSVWFELPVGG